MTIYVRTADLKSELQQLPSGTDGQITATYDVRGSYGTEAVVGTVTLAGTLSNDTVPPCRLDAHIGALHVTGTIRFDEQPDGQTNSASATYNVSAS